MTLAVGFLLAAGVLLVASPWLWPRREGSSTARDPLAPLADLLARAGVASVSPFVLLGVVAMAGIAGGALTLLLVPVVALAPVAAVVAATVPLLVLRGRAAARRRALRAVWPDVVDHLLSGVRAGLSLPQAIAALADSAPEPVRAPFRTFRRDYLRTAQFTECLDALKATLADPVADRIVETLRMAREVGGTELPSVLRSLSHYLRADAAVRAEVDARQSWVRTAARLGVVAPWIVLLLLSTRPEAAAAYNSTGGAVLVVGGLAATLVAYRLMIALGRLPEEGRWFR
ncbi:type II secretion system F family protein [Microcella humidisoli]|uniref:Type II secretion system F family protein n=1 Tax=Microcella humidisoli TaxID=2963406 RepID=A0ABY5FYC2_9MICO|nr:type II secretion system F family protein [Microcella humidisoli]UTT62751.1 type II secretion system F family protein [Microcella humidisoli]